MDFEEKTINRKEIFKGHVIDVFLDEVELPEQKGFSQRELVFHKGAVAILALDLEGKIILIKQYRKVIERAIYEIPAGKLEIGEKGSEKMAALRELEEETGYTTKNLSLIYDFYTAIGFCDERVRLYFTEELIKVENPRPQDEDETLEIVSVTLDEALDLVKSGEICDAKTIMAIQYLQLHRSGAR